MKIPLVFKWLTPPNGFEGGLCGLFAQHGLVWFLASLEVAVNVQLAQSWTPSRWKLNDYWRLAKGEKMNLVDEYGFKSWSVCGLEKNFQTQGRMRGEESFLKWEMLLGLWAGSRESWSLSQAAAAAKSFQSCLTLCDPIDGSPRGSPVPGILQARTLEWVAISFSNA